MFRQTNPNIASPRPHGTMSRSVTLFVTLFRLTHILLVTTPENRGITVSQHPEFDSARVETHRYISWHNPLFLERSGWPVGRTAGLPRNGYPTVFRGSYQEYMG